MKTASIDRSHTYGTSRGINILATYRGKEVHSITCHDSEEYVKLAGMREHLKLRGFTHYRDFGIGPLRKL